ncbi:MAG TPA: FecR domain-containing protein, partial [Myxococcaceae bacterium]
MARHETEALWAFAAGELEPEAQARVAGHVAACEACATKLEQVRQSQTALHAAREDVPSVQWSKVDDRLQSAAAQRLARLDRRPRWPWALAATGALAAVLAFLELRPGTTPAPSAPVVAVREQPPAPEVKPPEPPVVARQEPPPAPVAPPVPQEPAPVAAPILATRVESATGAWIRDSKARERVLEPGTQLKAGASVRTRAKSNALLQLPDESRVRLSPNSEVTLASTAAEDVHLTVKRGRLAVRASHAARKGFIVEAAGVRASVVGTIFSVERTARGAVVAVLEGKVQVESKGLLPRLVSAGQRVEVIPGK